MPSYTEYNNPIIRQFIEAGIHDISSFGFFARLTWIWPFAQLHTTILCLMQLSFVVWIRRKLLWCYRPLIYEPLSRGEIRVLNLHTGNLCTSIRCTLSHISLVREICSDQDVGKAYQALSYTWGPARPTAPIICNGQILEVTKNLYEALLYLRHRGLRTIWIDAICIDQGNLEERAAQVRLMKQIYDGAHSLIIWLGAGAKATDEGFRFIDYINKQVTYSLGRPTFDIDLFAACSDASFTALGDLLSRNWFYRIWIIQEVLSGRHKAMMYCGKAGRRWIRFMNGIDCLAQRGLISSIPDKQGKPRGVFRQLELFRNVNPPGMDLMRLATMARAAQATDPRDKIYALLGLARDMDDLRVITGTEIIPFEVDYTRPVRDVYMDAAKAMISSSGLHGVLSQVRGIDTSTYNLPSWVPDWSVPKKGSGIDWESWQLDTPDTEYRLMSPLDSDAGSQQRYFNASQNFDQWVFDEDETLRVQGVEFDTLKDLSGIYPGNAGKEQASFTGCGAVVQWQRNAPPVYRKIQLRKPSGEL